MNELVTFRSRVQDITKALTSWDTSALGELLDKASQGLMNQLQPGSPLVEDGELALKTFETLARTQIAAYDAKRKLIDSIVKAQPVLDNKPLDDSLGFPVLGEIQDPELNKPVDSDSIKNASIKSVS